MVNFKGQAKLRGLVEWKEKEETLYGRGVDGAYYKAVISGEGKGNWWAWKSVWIYKYTGDNNDGPGGYTDWEILEEKEWKDKWKKTVNWSKEEDEQIVKESWERITRVFSSVLTGQSVSPEDLDRL